MLEVALGTVGPGQPSDLGADPVQDERLARSPVTEQADRQRRPQLAGGDQGGQREGVAVGVQQVLAGPVV